MRQKPRRQIVSQIPCSLMLTMNAEACSGLFYGIKSVSVKCVHNVKEGILLEDSLHSTLHSSAHNSELPRIISAQRACSGSAEGDRMFFLYSLYFPAGRCVCDRGRQYCVILAVFQC